MLIKQSKSHLQAAKHLDNPEPQMPKSDGKIDQCHQFSSNRPKICIQFISAVAALLSWNSANI